MELVGTEMLQVHGALLSADAIQSCRVVMEHLPNRLLNFSGGEPAVILKLAERPAEALPCVEGAEVEQLGNAEGVRRQQQLRGRRLLQRGPDRRRAAVRRERDRQGEVYVDVAVEPCQVAGLPAEGPGVQQDNRGAAQAAI